MRLVQAITLSAALALASSCSSDPTALTEPAYLLELDAALPVSVTLVDPSGAPAGVKITVTKLFPARGSDVPSDLPCELTVVGNTCFLVEYSIQAMPLPAFRSNLRPGGDAEVVAQLIGPDGEGVYLGGVARLDASRTTESGKNSLSSFDGWAPSALQFEVRFSRNNVGIAEIPLNYR